MPISQPSSPLPGSTVRELIAALAQIEDAVRSTPTFLTAETDGGALLNPELVDLIEQERRIVAALRSQRASEMQLEAPSTVA